MSSPPSPVATDVKTLYVSGLPHDVKEREIQLLCRPFSGFEFCNLNTRSDQPSAFVKFIDRESATTALQSLQGFQFDLNHPDQLIRVEFARSDTMKKYLNPDDYDDGPDGKRRRLGTGLEASSYYPNDAYYQHYGSYPPHGYGSYYPYYPPYSTSYSSSSPGSSSSTSHPNATNTLFVGNLPPYCTENDLLPLFRHHPGFKQMRFTNLKNRQVAFVQFVDAAPSAFALSQMAGTRLFGNTLRIEFAQESKDPNR